MRETLDRFDFQDLFVLDLANNHQGSLAHGKAIIEACAEIAARHQLRAALKFQFRDLDSFVHADHLVASDNKHVDRFLSTRLDWDDYRTLLAVVRQQGLVAICTPFDEPSVDKIAEMEFDAIKIASCSANDWPLLEKAASTGMPLIVSTGGLTLDQIDNVVSFVEHRGSDFALMHCVSIYPTPDAACNLSNIAAFRARYPGRVIGWSTHENPDDIVPVGMALAYGAEMFERHVGLETEEVKLNAYSSTPDQLDAWMHAYKRAKTLAGSAARVEALPEERQAIDGLARGVFARRPIGAGSTLQREDIYFAFPYVPGSLSSAAWRSGIVTLEDTEADAPVREAAVEMPGDSDEQVIKDAVHDVKALLNLAHVPRTSEFTVEYSHHYGIRNFRKIGAILISVINREYCKKVLVQLPGQIHPWHYHKRKEETFLLLYGTLHVEVEDRLKILLPGDTLLVQPGVWHRFWSEEGCVFEEISTTHFDNDSVYRDEAINRLTMAQRKTVVDHWGRFQISDQLREAEVPASD